MFAICVRAAASIGDFVWHDLDHDGIQDAGEPGVAGVDVRLEITIPDGTVINQVTTTDSSGAYGFGYLLLDAEFDGMGPNEPVHRLFIDTPKGCPPRATWAVTTPSTRTAAAIRPRLCRTPKTTRTTSAS